ncbi:MAG: exonuclease domain-containing protein, partial [Pseudomonadota bacterium]
MLTKLSLRFRIFLFFCLLALGGVALAAGALAFGWSRADSLVPVGPFLTAFILFAFLNTGLVVIIWLFFDENIAKPINRLSANLRLRAHSGVDTDVSHDSAQYLGDLAPATEALAQTLSASLSGAAGEIVQETERLTSERAQLTALLTEIPIATILLNAAQEIVLYDGQAAALLSEIAPPRLKAPLADYFDLTTFLAAQNRRPSQDGFTVFELSAPAKGIDFKAKLKALDDGGHMIFVDVEMQTLTLTDPRPLVFDFDLINATDMTDLDKTPLSELCFVPFDTETTGLSVEKDDIVQLGAVRVLNRRIVAGEVMDVFVNPGRPIPP